MNIVKQFSVSLVNRPGVLANICRGLADAKVNIIALTIADSADLGILRMVVNNPEITRNTLNRLDAPVNESDVLWIEIPNRPGALAGIVEKLSLAHINIDYAYVTTGLANGKATAILKVQYPEKAMKVLKENESSAEKRVVMRPMVNRR